MRIKLLTAALLASGIASAATPVDGWYTSLFGGYSYFPSNIRVNDEFGLFRDGSGYRGGYNAGGRIGYQSNPIRYELEYTYMNSDTTQFDIGFVPQLGVSGDITTNMLMANIYYDFPEMIPAIFPFLGVGIGYAHVEAELNSLGPNGVTFFNPTTNSFAYQGTAGITYNFAENYAVNLSYRYAATGKTSEFGKVIQMHLANAGVIYRFDYGNYK
ncbi:MAG: outer membrane beta-barrel protein [Legionella sp.]|nr:outer membrane beta-barrel protein [Legionella sp.]